MAPYVVATASTEAAELLRDAIGRLLDAKGTLDSEFESVWSGFDGGERMSADNLNNSPTARWKSMVHYLAQLREQEELLGQLEIVLKTRIQLLQIQMEQYLEDENKREIAQKKAPDRQKELQRQEELRRFECERLRFTSLPREILSHIFCLCVEPEGVFQPVIMVGSVCARFRTISLKIPALWALVSSSMTAEQLNTHLNRAAKKKLNVKIFGAPFLTSSAEVERNLLGIRRLVQHSNRWGQVEILGDARIIPVSSRLPRLSSILIGNRSPILANGVNEVAAFHEQSFPEWITPNLRSINCTNTYSLSSFGASLVTCQLSWVGAFTPSPGRMVYTLSKSPALRSLTLYSAIDSYDRSFDSQDTSVSIYRASLEELRDLTVVIQGCCAQSACLRIISQISAPKLRTLNVKLGGTLKRNADYYSNTPIQELAAEDSMQNLLRLPEVWDSSPMLEELNFRCDYPQPEQFDCVSLLMMKMPALRKLSFEAPSLSPPWLLLLPGLEPIAWKIMQGYALIEHIEIRNNDSVSIKYIFKLANIINSMSRNSQTKLKLFLIDCRGLKEEDTELIRRRLPNIVVKMQTLGFRHYTD